MEKAASTPHRWLVRTIIGLATLVSIVAIFAVWANRQLLNTDGWTTTSTKLIESPPIRDALSGFVTEEIYANVDVSGELRSTLPEQLKPLAGPAAGALRTVVQRGVSLALERPLIQELWRGANQVAHAQFVKLVENKGEVVKLPGGGAVVLDLRPLLTQAASRVGVPSSTVEQIPPDAAEIEVVKSKQVQTLQTAVNVLRGLALALPLLALFLYGLAVYLARGRRPRTLISIGAALIFAGVVVLIARSLIGKAVVESLASTESIKPAASAAWSIGTALLVEVAGGIIFIGVPVILAGMLGGPSQTALRLRHSMAPYLRERPAITYGVTVVLLLILFAWGPIQATRNWLGIIVIIALSLFGTEMLRREAAAEFPDAQFGPPGTLRRRLDAIGGWIGGRSASLRAEARSASRRWRADGPSPEGGGPRSGAAGAPAAAETVAAPAQATAATQATAAERTTTPARAQEQGGPDLPGQLQRLAALHAAGALTDEEYAAAKRQLLSGGGN